MSNQTAIPFVQMRGGSSKGIYFHLADLPQDKSTRDNLLKWVMGAYGDPRQIDGLGGVLIRLAQKSQLLRHLNAMTAILITALCRRLSAKMGLMTPQIAAIFYLALVPLQLKPA